MAETIYRLLWTTSWRRRLASGMVGLLLAFASTSVWWEFHVPGPRPEPLWVYGAILALITGGGGIAITHSLLWLWYEEHEVLRRCQAYRAQQLSAVLEMSNQVRNALQVICHAGWLPRDVELYAMVQSSVARIESELRHLVDQCDHASHESPGHGGIEPDGLRVLVGHPDAKRSEQSLLHQKCSDQWPCDVQSRPRMAEQAHLLTKQALPGQFKPAGSGHTASVLGVKTC